MRMMATLKFEKAPGEPDQRTDDQHRNAEELQTVGLARVEKPHRLKGKRLEHWRLAARLGSKVGGHEELAATVRPAGSLRHRQRPRESPYSGADGARVIAAPVAGKEEHRGQRTTSCSAKSGPFRTQSATSICCSRDGRGCQRDRRCERKGRSSTLRERQDPE